MASAVELRFGPATLHLSPSAYADLLGTRRVGKHLQPTVQARALARLTRKQLAGEAVNRPEPATVALVDGRPEVVSAQPGVRYAPRDVALALLRGITSADRTARVRPTPAQASFTDADARRLGIRQQLAWSTVRLPRGSQDDALASAVHRLDGTVLKPRQALSIRRLLGSATPTGASGNALATALFNAAWMGGLQVTAHATSRSYDGTVPVGRDASLRDGQDLAFTDNTRYGVLVSAVAGRATASHRGSVTVTLWSTPQWTIRSANGNPTNVVSAGRDVRRGKQCSSRDGRDGFQVTVTRSFARGGAVDHTSSYTVRYTPVDAVVCKSHHHRRHH
jgi:vancomycin resistance protein YoaR